MQDLNTEFTLKDCLFGAVKSIENADPDKYSYSGCGIGFDSRWHVSYPDFDWGKNVVIFGVENRSSVYIDHTKKDILVLGEGATLGLDGTVITAEVKYSINFSRSQRKFCSNLHYNVSNSFFIC